jgi:15-cis-phytoene synthase
MRRPLRPLEEPYRSRAVPPGTARYWSWLFAAHASREPLLGIYALLAEWRALMDPGTEAAVAQLKLAWWQDEMQRLTAGAPVHPVSRYLTALPRAGTTDFAPLIGAVQAAARHVAGAPLERGGELEAHSSALRGRPLMVAAQLAEGFCDPVSSGRSVAALAAAEYLTLAIGDYRREALAGRVALPVDELQAAGIEDADLTAAEPPPHLQSYLEGLRGRAAQLFADAATELPAAERAQLRHLLILAALGTKNLHRPGGAADAGVRLRDLYLAWITARHAAAHA